MVWTQDEDGLAETRNLVTGSLGELKTSGSLGLMFNANVVPLPAVPRRFSAAGVFESEWKWGKARSDDTLLRLTPFCFAFRNGVQPIMDRVNFTFNCFEQTSAHRRRFRSTHYFSDK